LPGGLQNQAGDAALAKTVGKLAEGSAAALLVFSPAPASVFQAAADKELPILVVPPGTALREVHQDITGLLVDQQRQINERGMQLYRRLTEMSREGQGIASMTEVMSRLTGKIVIVQDKRLEFIAITIPSSSAINEEELCALLCRPESLPDPLGNRKAVANFRQSHWQQLLPMANLKMARLISPIISGDRARGYVSVIGGPDELDLLDALTAEHGAAACALEMAKAKAISETKKALQGNFLEGLLAGKLTQQEVQRLAGRLGHDPDRQHAVMTFAWDREDPPSLRRLETPINGLLSSYKQPALTHIYGDDHVCVFQALEDGDEDLGIATELIQRIQEHIQVEFPDVRLLCGLSGPALSIEEWPTVHDQAVQAMLVGKRLQTGALVRFNSLEIYQLLAQLEDLPAVRRFCDQIAGPLVNYDKEHNSSLVETANAYFNHHGNVSQTAEALYIHRNTLLYRLDRIQELSGQDLDRADMRMALHLALKLWQLRPEDETHDAAKGQ
jgi:purine catabolism regulator